MENNLQLDFKKLEVVDLAQVRPNTWNPKDQNTKEYREVLESIRLNGLKGFISVRENPNNDSKFEIIDGEQRWRACKELAYTKIIIYNEGKVEDKKAKELTLWWQTQAPFNEISLAKMVASMVKEFGEIQTPYTEKRLEELKNLANFNWDKYKPADNTTPPPVGELLKSFMVQVTTSQYDIIQQALDKAKKEAKKEGNIDITDSKALEFVCAEYINSPSTEEKT